MPGRRIATVLMLDVVGSTHVAAQLGDARYRELSSRFNRLVRAALKRFGGREEDHAGDGFFVTFAQPDRAIRCAASLADEVRALGIEIRSGIHTGQTEDQAGKTHGIAVVIGARVMSLAGAGEILVTSTTKELVTGSGFGFEGLSAHELKGVPGTWQVFAVTAVDEKERARPLPAAEAAERQRTIEPPAGRERPRWLVPVAAAIGALIVASIGVAITRGDPDPAPTRRPAGPASGSVVQLDADGKTLDMISAPVMQDLTQFASITDPSDPLVVGQGGVWSLRQRRILFHIDPLTSSVRARITLDVPPFAGTINVAEGLDAIWAAHGQGLIRVNPATDEQRHVARIRPGPFGPIVPADVAVGAGQVWVGTGTGGLLRLDPTTGNLRRVDGLDPIDAIAVGHGSVWTLDTFAGAVTRYDPGTMRRAGLITIAGGIDDIVAGERAIWGLSRSLGSLTRFDVDEAEAAPLVQVGAEPTAIAAGLGAIWVSDEDGVIRRVDEDTRSVTEIPFGAPIRAIAIDEEAGTLWVEVA